MGIREYIDRPYQGAGIAYDLLTEQRFEDEKCLERYGYKVYSQNDEDGIIAEIFRRIGTTDKTFVEFGVQNGLECNSHYLLHHDWRGLWIEGSENSVKEVKLRFNPVLQSGQLKVQQAFITKDNINFLIARNGLVGEIDLLSVDIDGNDYYVWQAIDVVNPRVVIVEYNAKFPPDCIWKQAYNQNHTWDGSDWQGASLKAFEKLGRSLGYRLVGTNISGVNAFFVRRDLAGDLFMEPDTAEALYNPARFGKMNFVSGHKPRVCLHNQQPNLGMANYLQEEYLRYKNTRSELPVSEEEKNKLNQRMAELRLRENGMCRKLKYGRATFYLPLADEDFIQRFILLYGCYFEADLLDNIFGKFRGGLLKHLLSSPDSVALDIGANIGNHSIYFALEVGMGKVISFEAVPETYKILERNIELNRLGDKVEIHCLGVSDGAGKAHVGQRYTGNTGGTELSVGTGDIKLVTVDGYNYPRVDFMKIDVEGMEPQVLKGAEQTIRRCRPYIMLESFPDKKPLVDEFMRNLAYGETQMGPNDYLFYPLSPDKPCGDILPADYDIVIPVDERYTDVLVESLPFIRTNISHRRIVLICSPQVFARFTDDGVELCDENEVWPGLNRSILQKSLTECGDAAAQNAAYYFRELVAMKYASHCTDEHYLLWNVASVPLQPITFTDLDGQEYFSMKPGRYMPHFNVINKLFGHAMKILSHEHTPSFISEGLFVNTARMREMMDAIGVGSGSWQNILSLMDAGELSDRAFSLAETYGTYLVNQNPQAVKGVVTSAVDDGYAVFGRLLRTDELKRLPYESITFR